MSEKLHVPEREPSPEQSRNNTYETKTDELALNNVESIDIDKARNAIEQAKPISNESIAENPKKSEQDSSNDFHWWSKELGAQTFERTLSTVRRRLTITERQFSKLIHRPLIEKASEVGEKTIARPSGILLGGIFSFIGSIGVYLLAKHIGGELRYSIFAITFILGYLLGLIVELVWRLATSKKSKNIIR